MNSVQAYPVAKSDKKYISVGYNDKQSNQILTEFQIEGATKAEFTAQMDDLMVAQQKACLILSYCSSFHLLKLTLTAIYQHIKQRLQMIFSQSV